LRRAASRNSLISVICLGCSTTATATRDTCTATHWTQQPGTRGSSDLGGWKVCLLPTSPL
jgi:hypothetical protein